ncbi:MAG TPA: hemin uptake protein HemP [Phycisphaerae bacterium]|nr:hemin uptake protein HemP [Phycisphaerae bacterium]HNU46666.1 hemin uptake protein HemP [Phycisphaerae bacterium]
MDRKATSEAEPQPARQYVSQRTPVIDSARLFGSHKEIQIRHGDEVYRLRITSNGRLILNK